MTPGSVPFSDQPSDRDGGDGRPPGASPNNGRPGGQTPPIDPAQRQRQLIPRRRGEPVRAGWDEERAETMRVGELTTAILEEYPAHTVGRVTEMERRAVEANEAYQHGPVAIIPVNPEYDVREIRAFRLQDGLSMIVGQREDGALVARALCFREPQFDIRAAEEMALRWGFITAAVRQEWAEAVPSNPSAGEIIAEALRNPETMAAVAAIIGEVFAKLQPNVQVVIPELPSPAPPAPEPPAE